MILLRQPLSLSLAALGVYALLPMPADWLFADSPNVAVFSTRQVFRSGQPILRVTHDADDGAWQFHAGGIASEADAMVVALQEVFAHDPSIAELFDLPLGWFAERASAGQSWVRRPQPPPNSNCED